MSTNAEDLDYIAQDAGEGAVHGDFVKIVSSVKVKSGSYTQTIDQRRVNSVTVVLERSSGDASRTERAYAAFAGEPSSEIIQQHGNAVVVWDKTPTADERNSVAQCVA